MTNWAPHSAKHQGLHDQWIKACLVPRQSGFRQKLGLQLTMASSNWRTLKQAPGLQQETDVDV